MKRFWTDVTVAQADGGFRVALDGRALRTPRGAPQVVPTRALADALAAEWRAQGEVVDPRRLLLRDLTDLALDVVVADRADAVARLVPYGDTDTLCYRADPDDPLYRHQLALWEPVLAAAERRLGVRFERTSGVLHRPQPPATLARLRERVEGESAFTLAALLTMAPLTASLTTALAALEPDADIPALFAAANCEEDWQAEQWGWDGDAEHHRAARLAVFTAAARFARLAQNQAT